MVENSLTSMGDLKLGVNDLIFVKVLLILEMETCFIFAILLARDYSLLSVRLNIFRAHIRLKISISEYNLLKPNLDLSVLSIGSAFSLLLDRRTKVIAFASQPLG